MAGRTPIIGARPVTVRLSSYEYDSIKEYAQRSPTGITAAEIIRNLVSCYGLYCRARLDAGHVASSQDLVDLEQFVADTIKRGIII